MLSNPRNIPKLNYSSLLLTMVFSMGEPMPVTSQDYLGQDFLRFVLDNIEAPPDTDLDEQIPDLFLNLLISFNLQFDEETLNPLLVALDERQSAKAFSEKILLLLNREGGACSQRTRSGSSTMSRRRPTRCSSCSRTCSVDAPPPSCSTPMTARC
ncbi:hypothetical protein YQE_08457, partial [Dendroctonus ponderosae]